VHFEPFENRAYDMSYACLLIPRDPEHLLTGKVADFIRKCIQNVCIAFGWHLVQVQVQPEYFQWVVSAKVGTPPSKCIHMIREETSKGILAAFRQFKPPDGYADFWAPGYLVLVGDQPHPPSIIQEFIKLTRQQQGLSKRSNGEMQLGHDNHGT
jgi:REP element-mobilizing transposase RayT